MDLILDTCGLLSLAGIADKKLSQDCLSEIQGADRLFVSACAAFEIALKHKRGQLDLRPFQNHETFWEACMDQYALTEVQVSAELFSASVRLPDHHADPFDRLIIASAQSLKAPIITYDGLFRKYPVQLMS